MLEQADIGAELGAWVVALYKSFQHYNLDDPVFYDYESVVLAGKSAELLAKMRALETVSPADLEAFARSSRLKPNEARQLLATLASLDLVEIEHAGDGVHIASVKSRVRSENAVYAAVAQYFATLIPRPKAIAALRYLRVTVDFPQPRGVIIDSISAEEGVGEDAALTALDELVSLDVLQGTEETEHGEPLIFNPRSFKATNLDLPRILSGLTSEDCAEALAIIEYVRENPGFPIPEKHRAEIRSLLVKLGIIDVSGIGIMNSDTKYEFATMPSLWVASEAMTDAIRADLIDDAKVFLNSLRYGQIFSPAGLGRIRYPSVLVEALINRGQVGPASAIGQHYPLVLQRGIVDVARSRLYPDRFYMQLRKREVAESVLPLLDAAPTINKAKLELRALESTSSFDSPETVRATRAIPKPLRDAQQRLIFGLRTYRRRM